MVQRVNSTLHLWVGLALSALLILLSVTGSTLVFRHEIDGWLNPSLLRVEPGEETKPLAEVVAAAEAAAPEATTRFLRVPRSPAHAVEVWMSDGRNAYVDPYTAEVLGLRGTEEGAMNVLFALHAELLAGDRGETVVGIIGLLALLTAATGMVLWWPSSLRWSRIRKALVIERRLGPWRLNYDLHRSGGFYTALFLVLVAATGSGLVFYDVTKSLLNTATGSALPPPPPTASPEEEALDPAVLSRSMAIAHEALPDGVPTFVSLPRGEGTPLSVRLKTPSEGHPNGRSYVYIAPASGRVLGVVDGRTVPLGTWLLNLLYPLHIGAIGGGVVKVLYVLLGISPAVLSVTGTLIWYRRWRRKYRTVAPPPPPVRRVVPVRLPPNATRPRPHTGHPSARIASGDERPLPPAGEASS